MLITVEVKVDSRINEIANELACLSSDKQAEFLDRFMGHLYAECEGRHHEQLSYVKGKISPHTKEMLKELL